MKQKLNKQQILGLGFMLFALFLGAGNLIFPPIKGMLAGENVWQAALGFILSAVGLPLMGVIAICLVGGGFNTIAKELPKSVIGFLGCMVFLVIGLYATPRTALVASEMSIDPFFGKSTAINIIFAVSFFVFTWYLSIYPGKLLETVGQIITPLLIFLLIIMGVTPLIKPLGSPGLPQGAYSLNPIIKGFMDGYLTMDALGALMFGVVLVANLKSHGITGKKTIIKYGVITSLIAATGLTLSYIALFNIGAKVGQGACGFSSGTQILTYYANTVFGFWGNIGIALVVTLACLTTAVGCVTAVSEYFLEFSDKISYKFLVSINCLICLALTGLGLEVIIKIFIPVLAMLYPVCISLIFLTLLRPFIKNSKLTYRCVLSLTFIVSLIETLSDKGLLSTNCKLWLEKYFPLFSVNLSWAFFALLVLVITMIFSKKSQNTALARNL